MLPAEVAVESLELNDAWFRDTGPAVSSSSLSSEQLYIA